MEYTDVFKNVPLQKVKKEFTQKDFIRDTLVKISAKESTPVDILSSKFSDVAESEVGYAVANANVNINYTCMIGIDRTEEYWDKEPYSENGTTKYRDVKKTRTVTDWSPFSGKNSSFETLIVENNEPNGTGVHVSGSLLKACKKESVEDCGTTDIGTPALPRMQAAGEKQCFHRVHLPGDHQKDERYSGSVDVTVAQGLVLPFYSATYNYNGIEYTAASCASGILSSNCTFPNESENVQKQAKQKARPYLIASPISLVLGIVLAMLVPNLFFLSTLFLLGFVGLLITYFVMKKEYYKKITSEKLKEKKNRLIKKLSSEGMQELSVDELALFDK